MARAGALLAIAALTALALVLAIDTGTPAAGGTFPVAVVGPDGVLFSGNVTTHEATAYSVLRTAAAEAGFDVDAQGRGESLFVTRIGAYGNTGAGGWCYAVWEDGWVRPAHSAALAGLRDGQAVRWTYEAEGCGTLG